MPPQRIQKVIAAAGLASRREAERLIAAGRVTVDGRVATLGEAVDPESVAIELDGRPIGEPAPIVHLVVHKPAGVTATVRDPHATATVLSLVPPDLVAGLRLYPVGRLDRDSEGLLVITNDGAWADRVLHPRYGVEREYAVGLCGPLTEDQYDNLAAGIRLEEGIGRFGHLRRMTPTEIHALSAVVRPGPDELVWYRVTLAQGWKRQVRRMFAAVGAPVERLVRVRIGTLRLGDLHAGGVRRLTTAEVHSLGEGRLAPPRRPVEHAPADGDGHRVGASNGHGTVHPESSPGRPERAGPGHEREPW